MDSKEVREAKREHWKGILARQEESGLSGAQFCREQGIAQWKFGYWKRRLKEEEVDVVFQEVRLDGGGEQASSTSSAIELELGTRVRVRLQPGFDAESLERVLAALSGAQMC